MKRGEEKFWIPSWTLWGFGIARSRDGMWAREDGRRLPWLWVSGATERSWGITLKIGEYLMRFARLR